MKKLILKAIDKVCWWLDQVPRYEDSGWSRYGRWGCESLKLANLGDRLENRWKTGIWDNWAFPVSPQDHSSLVAPSSREG